MLIAPFYKIELKMWKQRVVVQMRENISSTEHVPYKNNTPLKFTKHIPTRKMSWTLTQDTAIWDPKNSFENRF